MKALVLLVSLSLSISASAATIVPLSPPALTAPAPLGGSAPILSTSGDMTLAVWIDAPQSAVGELVARRFNANGFLDPYAIPLANGYVGADVAATSQGWVIGIQTSPYGMSVRFVGRDGSAGPTHELEPPTCTVGSNSNAISVASSGDRVAILTTDCLSVMKLTITDARGEIVVPGFVVGNAGDVYHAMVSAAPNGGFAVIAPKYAGGNDGQPYELDARVVDRDGNAAPWQVLRRSEQTFFFDDVAFDGTNVVIAGHYPAAHLITWSGSGAAIDRGEIAPSSAFASPVLDVSNGVRRVLLNQSEGSAVYDLTPDYTLGARVMSLPANAAGGSIAGEFVSYADSAARITPEIARMTTALFPPLFPAQAAPAQSAVRVATDGSLRVAVWLETLAIGDARIVSSTIDAANVPRAAIPLTTSSVNAHAPDIAYGNGEYLAVWIEAGIEYNAPGTLMGRRLAADGTPIEATPFIIADNISAFETPHVAYGDGRWLVVFERQVGQPDLEVHAVRVDAQGFVLDPVPMLIAPPKTSRSTTRHASIAWTGRDFAVVYQHYTWFGGHSNPLTFIGATLVHPDATITASRQLTIEATSGSGAATYGAYFDLPQIAVNGDLAYVAWFDTTRNVFTLRSDSALTGVILRSDTLTPLTTARRRVMSPDPPDDTFAATGVYALLASGDGFDVVTQAARGAAIEVTHVSRTGVHTKMPFVTDPGPTSALETAVRANAKDSVVISTRTDGAPSGTTLRAFWVEP